MSNTFPVLNRLVLRGAGSALALPATMAALLLAPAGGALAACDPAAGNNVTATCTGVTFNAPNGYGSGSETNLNVTVVSGASVTGSSFGIRFDTGSVVNFGTIAGISNGGIAGFVADVTNHGTISGDTAIGAAIANVNNSGTISGGGNGILGTSVANVTNSGTITAALGNGVAGNNIVNLTNSGTIAALDSFGAAAFGGTVNVTNHGVLSGANVIYALDVANVSNWGSIAATFTPNSIGIFSENIANVSNWGSITTNGATSGVGINVFVDANVTNRGTISGTGLLSGSGILAGGAANVVNWGSIAATGSITSTGIDGASVNIFNCGTISAIGGISIGIQARSGVANVTNCGTISGGTAALGFTSNADTLTLLPGSKIIGAINLAGGGDTVNFRGGNHNLTFDTLAGATVTGTTPFVVSGNRAVAIDPTPFAAAGTALGDFTRSVSAIVPVFETQGVAAGGAPMAFAAPGASAPGSPASTVSAAFDQLPGLSAYAADQAVFKAPTVTHGNSTFWARGFGGHRIQDADGALLRNVSYFLGGAMGMDTVVSTGLRIGGFIGAGSVRTSIELNSGGSDGNLGFGGLYARYLWGASFLHAAVQGGRSRTDITRTINNNLVAGGLEAATASYNGWYVSPELTFGHHFALGHFLGAQHTLTPRLQVRYLHGSFDGYTETGSTANLTVTGQTVQTLEERAELKLTRSTVLNPYSALLVHLTGGALGVQRVGGNSVNALLLGQAIPFATPGKDDVWGGFGGLGMEFRNANISTFASGEYLALSDQSSVISGKAGLRVAF